MGCEPGLEFLLPFREAFDVGAGAELADGGDGFLSRLVDVSFGIL